MKTNGFPHVLTALLALWAVPGLAQSSTLDEGDRRIWARGVSLEDQQLARQLFLEGFAFSEQGLFADAVERYQRALQHWDHPAIHYNLAIALQSLDRPLELREHLERALRFDGKPLDEVKIKRARDLKKVVEQQLVRVELICDAPGATVSLGGETLCSSPSQVTRWLLPAEYTFTATQEGYSSELNARKRTFRRGENVTLQLRMYTDDELKRSERWLPGWVPWTLLGGGAAIAASGVLLYTEAHDNHRRFDAAIKACGGCVPESPIASLRTRGDRLQLGASGMYVASGAALITGLVLLYANQEQTRYVTADEHERQLNITPVLGDQPGAVVTLHF